MTKARLAFLLMLGAAMCPRAGIAAGPDCDAIAAKAETAQAHIVPVQSMRVTGSARLHFHRAPDAGCSTKVYVVANDRLLAYAEWNDWLWVQYTHPKTGTVSSGWIPPARTEFVGTMGPDPNDTGVSPARSTPSSAPKAVSDLVERAQLCEHFAGEFNGDQSEHDREVNKTMTELRCGSVQADVAAARKQYKDNSAAIDALDALDAE